LLPEIFLLPEILQLLQDISGNFPVKRPVMLVVMLLLVEG